jgi:hypothetical protein
MPSFSKLDDRRGGKSPTVKPIQYRQQVLTLTGALLLVVGLQLYAQQADLDAAAAAKAAAGREALIHTPAAVPGSVGTFISFDVPGAVNGTLPFSVNPGGTISGIYFDANFFSHGFVRSRNGTFTTFDVPGAVNGLFEPLVINPEGAITGTFADANVALHGFLRAKNGTFITFDAPGAGTGFFQGTQALGINPTGAITGFYVDANNGSHGFLRAKNGIFTTFDAPGACTTCPSEGTQAVDINPDGTIVGIYTDTNNNNHGFLRASDGTFTAFDPPGRINIFRFPFFGVTTDLYINPEGVITGTYFEVIPGNLFGGNFRVFVRAPSGTFATFDAANYPPCCIWSFPLGINPAGAITGSFNDGFNINHGFLRAGDGTVTTIDAPAAGTGFGQGTVPIGITPAGVIMGVYINTNGTHGFVLLPSGMVSASSQ